MMTRGIEPDHLVQALMEENARLQMTQLRTHLPWPPVSRKDCTHCKAGSTTLGTVRRRL